MTTTPSPTVTQLFQLQQINNLIKNLQDAFSNGIITAEELQDRLSEMEDKRRTLINETHPYAISKVVSKDGIGRKERVRWVTRIPDSTKKNGYREIKHASLDMVYQDLYEFYTANGTDPSKVVSLASLYDLWIKYRLMAVSMSTVKKDQSIWKRYYEGDPITKRSLDGIKPSEAFTWLSSVLETHQLTRRQYYEMRGIWKSIEGFAYNDDLIRNRIILNLQTPADGKFADEKIRYSDTATFTPEELDLLKEAAYELYMKSHFNTAYLGLELDSYLGFRVGELSCLRWSGINWDRRYITIRQSEETAFEIAEDGHIRNCGYNVVDHLKKKHLERIVPLPSEAEAILKYIRSENENHGIHSDFVFVQGNGERVHTRAFHKALKKVYAKLGWTGKKLAGIHEFRRTYATTLNGYVADKQLQSYMGHKDWSTTKRYYQYASREPDPSAADAISHAFQKKAAQNAS